MSCTNRIDCDADNEGPICGDEGHMCPVCFKNAAAYWAAYFGITADMDKAQRQNQLEAFRPVNWEPEL